MIFDNDANTISVPSGGIFLQAFDSLTFNVDLLDTDPILGISNNTDCNDPNGNIVLDLVGGSQDFTGGGPLSLPSGGEFTFSITSSNGIIVNQVSGILSDGVAPINFLDEIVAAGNTGFSPGVPNGIPGGFYTINVQDNFSNCSADTTIQITDPSPATFNINPTTLQQVCDNGVTNIITVSLDGSEAGVDYTIHVNGIENISTLETGTGGPIDLNISSSVLNADNDVLTNDTLTVVAVNGFCTPVDQNGQVVVQFLAEPTPFNITNGATTLCETDDLVIALDGSETGVDYQATVDGVLTGPVVAGTGIGINITLAAGSFLDGETIGVQATNGACPVVDQNNPFVVTVLPEPTAFTITNTDPTNVCDGDDLVITLDGSETGVDYQATVNGVLTGPVVAGDGSGISITLVTGSFSDSDIIGVQATNGFCPPVDQQNPFTVQILNDPQAFNITNGATTLCETDDLVIALDGSETGVDYQATVNGVLTGPVVAGTGAAINITLSAGSFTNGQTIGVQATNGACPVVDQNNPFVVTVLPEPTAFTITNTDPTNVCDGDDLVITLDGSETGVDYQATVNGVLTGPVVAGDGSGISITLVTGSFSDSDIIGVQATNGFCPPVDQQNPFTVQILNDPQAFNITNGATTLCETDDLVIALDGSETGVDYQATVDGVLTGPVVAGTGIGINITLAAGSFLDGETIGVQATNGACPVVDQNNPFVVTVLPEPTAFTITNTDPTNVCDGDDLVITLDGSETGVDYQATVNGVLTGPVVAGDGSGISITLVTGSFSDSDIIGVQATNGFCPPVDQQNPFTVQILNDPQAFNITNGATTLCETDDLVIALDGSETGVDYQATVNGVLTGPVVAGTGAAINITLSAGSFTNGQTIGVQATNGACPVVDQNNPFVVTVLPEPTAFTITNTDPTNVCDGDDLVITLDGSETGVDYQATVNGVLTGPVVAGDGSGISITLVTGSFSDSDIIGVQATNGFCPPVDQQNPFTVQILNDPQAFNITNGATTLCETDDLVIALDGSETGVDYQATVDGVLTGPVVAGTGIGINITLAAGSFLDGETIGVQATNGACPVVDQNNPFVVTVIPLPVANDAFTNVCTGDFVDLTASEADINNTGTVTFSYFEDVNLTIAVADPTNVQITASTIFFVLVEAGGTTNCSDTAQLTVGALPLPTANDVTLTDVCPGTVLDLTTNEGAINGGAVTYSYFEDAALTAAIGDPTAVTVNSDTSFFVLVVDNGTTCQDTAMIDITVAPLPTANDVTITNICPGTVLDLTTNEGAINGGAVTYSYFEDAALTAAIGDPTSVTVNSDTTFFVLVVDNGTTCQDTAMIDITTETLPTANDVALTECIGSTIDLTTNEGAINGGAGITYSYFEDVNLAIAVADPTNVLITASTSFFVLVEDGGTGCQDTAAIVVTAVPLPVANDAFTNVCTGDFVDLTASEADINNTGTVTFSYFEDVNLTIAVADPTNVQITASTIFFVLVEAGGTTNCSDTAQLTVGALPLPTANDVSLTDVCPGTVLDLTTNEGAINGGAVTYSYFEDAALTAAIGDPTAVTVNSDATFFVLVVDNGTTCQDTAMIDITVAPLPTANDVTITNICPGTVLDLTTNEGAINGGAVTYSYFEDAALTAAIGDPTSVTVNSDTTFFVLVVDNGTTCQDTAMIDITTETLPTANDVALTECIGSTIDLTTNEGAINGGAGITYSYFEDVNLAIAVADPTNVLITASTSFFVLVEDGGTGCQDTAAIVVTAVPLPVANDAFTNVCTGDFVDLTASEADINNTGTVTFSYFEDVNLTIAVADPTNVQITASTIFFVLVEAGGTTNCSDTAQLTVGALPLPTANDVSLTDVCPGTVLDLTTNEGAINGGAVTYSYFEDAALTAAIGDPTAVTVNSDATFFVLVVDNGTTCQDTAMIDITVAPLPTANDVTITNICPGTVLDLTTNEGAINGGAVTYSYFEDAALTAAIGDPTSVTVNSDTTFFVLVVDNGTTCQDTAMIDITTETLPTANDVALTECIGSTIDLTTNEGAINGGAGITYSYFEDVNLAIAVADPTNVLITASTSFFVLVEDGGTGCQDTAAIVVTAVPLPVANDAFTNVCTGDFVDLTASEADINNTGTVTFSYFEDVNLTIAVADPTNVQITASTIFFVLVEAGGTTNCSDTAQLTVGALPLPTANDVSLTDVCPGTVLDLTTNEGAINGGAVTYSYFEDAALTAAIGDPTAVTVNSDATFFVLVVDNGTTCQDTAMIDITVAPLPTANDVTITNICPGTVLDLTTNEGAINGGAVTYSYFEDAALTAAIGDPTSVTVNSDTTFFVLVVDNGTTCQDTAMIDITTLPGTPDNLVIDGPAQVCENQIGVTYTVVPSTPGSTYSWSASGAGISITSGLTGPDNDVITVDFGTTSGIILVQETNAFGCTSPLINLPVNVNSMIDLVVTINDPGQICEGDNVTLTADVTPAGLNPTFQWFINNVLLVGETNQSLQLRTDTVDITDNIRVEATVDPFFYLRDEHDYFFP